VWRRVKGVETGGVAEVPRACVCRDDPRAPDARGCTLAWVGEAWGWIQFLWVFVAGETRPDRLPQDDARNRALGEGGYLRGQIYGPMTLLRSVSSIRKEFVAERVAGADVGRALPGRQGRMNSLQQLHEVRLRGLPAAALPR